jgi:hypothetical protein
MILAAENPPVHRLLGNDGLKLVRDKLDAVNADITAWEDVARSTDFT